MKLASNIRSAASITTASRAFPLTSTPPPNFSLTSTPMDNEESLMNVLSRLSYSIEEAMRQKRLVETQLADANAQVKMLTQANNALMKHVAGLEKRNEIVVNGLMKVVDTVENNCRVMKQVSEQVEPASAEDSSFTGKVSSADEASGSTANATGDIAGAPVMEEAQGQAPEAPLDEVTLDEEPQSAELRSLADHPIDPLVYSNIMDYAAEPAILPQYHQRNSRLRSGRLRSGKLRSSGGLFRSRRMTESYVDGSRNVESRRCRRSGGIRHDSNAPPIPSADCGCFLQTIFGCRH